MTQTLASGGEAVTYQPEGGEDRAITVLVDRLPAETMPGMERGKGPRIEVRAANNASDGIAANEVDEGRDKITLAVRIGATPTARIVSKLIGQDEHWTTLEMR